MDRGAWQAMVNRGYKESNTIEATEHTWRVITSWLGARVLGPDCLGPDPATA